MDKQKRQYRIAIIIGMIGLALISGGITQL